MYRNKFNFICKYHVNWRIKLQICANNAKTLLKKAFWEHIYIHANVIVNNWIKFYNSHKLHVKPVDCDQRLWRWLISIFPTIIIFSHGLSNACFIRSAILPDVADQEILCFVALKYLLICAYSIKSCYLSAKFKFSKTSARSWLN